MFSCARSQTECCEVQGEFTRLRAVPPSRKSKIPKTSCDENSIYDDVTGNRDDVIVTGASTSSGGGRSRRAQVGGV